MQTSGHKSMFAVSPLTETGNRAGTDSCNGSFRIICIREGAGVCCIEKSMQTVGAGQLICIVPGCPYHFIPYPGASGHIITFSEAFLTQTADDPDGFPAAGLLLRFSLCPVINIEPGELDELSGIATKMIKESVNYYLLRTEILRRYLQIYLVYVLRQMDAAGGITVPENVCMLLKKFTSLLERHFKEKKMVADYAQQLGISPNYLNCMVKKYSGYPVSHHIKQRVVLEAKRKAIYSGYSMKEIAYDLGFVDMAHFSKYFKSVAGNNFSSFKKINQ